MLSVCDVYGMNDEGARVLKQCVIAKFQIYLHRRVGVKCEVDELDHTTRRPVCQVPKELLRLMMSSIVVTGPLSVTCDGRT